MIESAFNQLIVNFAFWLAKRYLYKHGHQYLMELNKELITTKYWIIKAQRKNSINRNDFFSIHHRVKSNSHGGVYSWYYEKFQIHLDSDNVRRYTLVSFGNYPYQWE